MTSSRGSLEAMPSGNESKEYIPPQAMKHATPHASEAALAVLKSPVAIQVEVKIDKSGRVTKARALNAAKVDGAIVEAAVSAAREWVFKPATLRGHAVDSQHTMVFQFQSAQGAQ
jgi:TonB family protein